MSNMPARDAEAAGGWARKRKTDFGVMIIAGSNNPKSDSHCILSPFIVG